ncbi:MAG: rane fusion protein multidrug efflux system [Mucilaginibacter sp.]|nr:rane fusion protein multidrug efflux system [Mucilaginibacter sp.]
MKTFPNQYRSNRKRVLIILSVLSLACCTLFLLSCGSKGKPNGGPQDNQAKVYRVLALSSRTATLNADYPASIQGQQDIEIRPKVDGFIEKIYVDEGSLVKKGQLLFKINAPQYEQEVRTAQAGINTAQADVNAAQLAVNKVKPLVEKDIISHYELESVQFTLQTKLAALAQAKAALANAKTNLGYTIITSPVNGVIGSLPYKLGSLVTSNTANPLTSVYNTSTVYAYFAINEKKLLDLSKDTATSGTTLKSKLNNLPKVSLLLADGTLYNHQGRIETVNGLINTATGSANVRAAFANPEGLLHSGNSAMVRIPTLIKSAILVPQSATYELQDKRFVYILDNQNKIKTTAIKVMDNTAGQFFVVQDGLHNGDKILLEDAGTLKDGTEVRPKEASADSVYKGFD